MTCKYCNGKGRWLDEDGGPVPLWAWTMQEREDFEAANKRPHVFPDWVPE